MHKHVITLRACATGKVIGRVRLSSLSVCRYKNGRYPDPGCSIGLQTVGNVEKLPCLQASKILHFELACEHAYQPHLDTWTCVMYDVRRRFASILMEVHV